MPALLNVVRAGFNVLIARFLWGNLIAITHVINQAIKP